MLIPHSHSLTCASCEISSYCLMSAFGRLGFGTSPSYCCD